MSENKDELFKRIEEITNLLNQKYSDGDIDLDDPLAKEQEALLAKLSSEGDTKVTGGEVHESEYDTVVKKKDAEGNEYRVYVRKEQRALFGENGEELDPMDLLRKIKSDVDLEAQGEAIFGTVSKYVTVCVPEGREQHFSGVRTALFNEIKVITDQEEKEIAYLAAHEGELNGYIAVKYGIKPTYISDDADDNNIDDQIFDYYKENIIGNAEMNTADRFTILHQYATNEHNNQLIETWFRKGMAS